MQRAPKPSSSLPEELIVKFTETATAFQPIVDASHRTVYAHEALVRGGSGEPAAEVFQKVDPDDLDRFDQSLRIVAIYEAARLKLDTRLHLNFLPTAMHDPVRAVDDIRKAAADAGLRCSAITFEIVEAEKIADIAGIAATFDYFRSFGFLTAMDDFGAGPSGLDLLSKFRPDIVKLDMQVLRGTGSDSERETIAGGMANMGRNLGAVLIGEGVETAAESSLLLEHGIDFQQGYLFARPAFRSLATPWE